MPEPPDFNFEEAIHAVLETRTALERASGIAERLERLLSQQPGLFASLAEPTFRLRDRLIEDLETLEARLAQAESAPPPMSKPFDIGGRAGLAEELGVSQGDVRALGGQ